MILTATFYFQPFGKISCVRWNCSAFVVFPADSYLLSIGVLYFSSPSNPISPAMSRCFPRWTASMLYSVNLLPQRPTDGLLRFHHWAAISRISSALNGLWNSFVTPKYNWIYRCEWWRVKSYFFNAVCRMHIVWFHAIRDENITATVVQWNRKCCSYLHKLHDDWKFQLYKNGWISRAMQFIPQLHRMVENKVFFYHEANDFFEPILDEIGIDWAQEQAENSQKPQLNKSPLLNWMDFHQ